MLIVRKICLICLLAIPCSFVFDSVSIAQAQDRTSNSPHFIFPPLAWANHSWTGDNQPYHAIRAQIDQSAAQGKITLEVLQANFKAFQLAPRNPLVLFRWAYADNLAVRRLPNLPPHPQPGDGAFEACPDPHTYDYERTRFLLNWDANIIALTPLAKRLLARDPTDYPVQYNLAGVYGGTDAPAEKSASIARAERLLIEYPHKPEIYGLLGGIYCDHWIFQKKAEDGQKAIFYYQKYLQLTRQDDPWRKQAAFWIKRIQSDS